jgi:hypothetical protein
MDCRGGDELEFGPDGGAAAFAVGPGVFFVGYDGPVLFVFAVLLDLREGGGAGAVGWDAACSSVSLR